MDKKNDNKWTNIDPNEPCNDILRIETGRSGVFKFHAGVDLQMVGPLIQRIYDAHDRFISVPILPSIATNLEKEVIAYSVFGTNTIEGASVSEEDTKELLERADDETPTQIADDQQKRILNIRSAYNLAVGYAKDSRKDGDKELLIFDDMIKDLHKFITDGLTHPDNLPGRYRNNTKDRLTKVGDRNHGGIYIPPKCLNDIRILMDSFVRWMNDERILSLDPLIRAPLIHYYFERIHPFWDGNGRVGRVLEAMVLKFAGYEYAPFALSRYYLEHIDEYFSVFNFARKQEQKKIQYPNTIFVEFFLKGILTVLNKQHDRVNRLISIVLYNNSLRSSLEGKRINDRQYLIVNNIMLNPSIGDIPTLRQEPWYTSLYAKLTDKTRDRDIKRLEERGFISINKAKKIEVLYP